MAYLFTLAGALANVLLGTIVYRRNPHSPVHQTFAWLMSATALWMATAFLSQKVGDPVISLLLVRLAFIAASAIALFGFLFATVFPNGSHALYTRRLWWTVWTCGIAMMVLAGSPYLVANVDLFPWGANVVPGPMYLLFPSYFIGFVVAGLHRLMQRWQRSKGIARHQIAYLLVGMTLTAIVGGTTNLILPLITGFNPYAQYGQLASLFTAGLAGYSILAYRLFDIRRLAGRTIVISGLLLFVWGAYSIVVTVLPDLLSNREPASVRSPERIASVLAGLVVALGFEPLKEWLERTAESILFTRRKTRHKVRGGSA